MTLQIGITLYLAGSLLMFGLLQQAIQRHPPPAEISEQKLKTALIVICAVWPLAIIAAPLIIRGMK